jgi:DNA-binding HxlR family transcriptional regulator
MGFVTGEQQQSLGGTDVLQRLGAFTARDDWSAEGWCRVERALALIGTRSAMIVVRELFFGGTRFDELARRTGLSEAVVAGRLQQLLADGVVQRRPYQLPGQRVRDEYILTERGRRLFPVLISLIGWGETLADDHDTGVEIIHRGCQEPLEAHVRCAQGHEVPLEQAAVRIKNEPRAAAGRRRTAANSQ